jgi:hypothetical protein
VYAVSLQDYSVALKFKYGLISFPHELNPAGGNTVIKFKTLSLYDKPEINNSCHAKSIHLYMQYPPFTKLL